MKSLKFQWVQSFDLVGLQQNFPIALWRKTSIYFLPFYLELADPVWLSLPSPGFQVTLWCNLEIKGNYLWFLTCPCSLGTILNFWLFLYKCHCLSWSSALQNSLIVTWKAAAMGCICFLTCQHLLGETLGAKTALQFNCVLCTIELVMLPHP